LSLSTSTSVNHPGSPRLPDLPAFPLRPPPFSITPEPLPPWRVVRARYGSELSVTRSLADLDLEAWCPRYRSRWVSRGRPHERLNVFLPTYVFSRFDPFDPYRWHQLMAIDGVAGFLDGIVSDLEITSLRLLLDVIDADDEPVYEVHHRFLPVGSEVRFSSGPFVGRRTIVVATDGFTAWVKNFGLLGRDNDINVPADWCEVITNNVDAASGNGKGFYLERTRSKRRNRARRAGSR
jgi:hypothetical protein